jgi:hypothetical protein
MIWSRLKSMKCPDCGEILNIGKNIYACADCDFKISKTKFNEIIGKLYSSKKQDYNDNLSELNNLGHEKVAEDFSDSNALNY